MLQLLFVALLSTPASAPTVKSQGQAAPAGSARARGALAHPGPGSFPAQWIHGSASCATNDDPPLQVHAYNANTYILRQNMCQNFEGAFMYLLLGNQKALLIDTGATPSALQFPLQATVKALVDQFESQHGLPDLELIVAHSHSHGDHVAGDVQFLGQPNTTVVGTSTAAIQSFFGITSWPSEIVSFGLGGRRLDVIPTPGHHPTHIMIYDRNTDLLFSGDSFMAGYLFPPNQSAYRASIDRVVDFAATHPIAHILGGHIEMTSTPGVIYPYGATYQPQEHELRLGAEHLTELWDALHNMPGSIVHEVHDDFVIFP